MRGDLKKNTIKKKKTFKKTKKKKIKKNYKGKIKICNSYNLGDNPIVKHFINNNEWVKVPDPNKADITFFNNEKNIIWDTSTISLVNFALI